MKGFATLLWALLLLLPASSLAKEQETSDQKWVELDYHNFEATVQANDWTCVLMYDPWDERGNYDHTLVLESIHERLQARNHPLGRVGFARLNQRQHAKLREEYTVREDSEEGDDEGQEEPFAFEYYNNWVEDPNALLTLTNETLLDVSLGTPYWPAQMIVLASNYNLYGQVDLSLILGALPLKTAVLDRWLMLVMDRDVHLMDPIVQTRANEEAELLQLNTELADNTFNFEAYDEADSDDEEEEEQEPNPNVRLSLETDSKDDGKSSSRGHFTYRRAKVKKVKGSSGYLETLGTVVEEYLAWVEGYETTWSEDRKAREDEQTNFGVYLQQMNQQIQEMLTRLLTEEHLSRQDPQLLNKMRINKDFAKQMQAPPLQPYFEELVFGSGRSVDRFRQVLDDFKTALGATPQERRQNRYDFNSSTIPMVNRLREYLTVYAAVSQDDKLYSVVLADLLTDWHNILRTFHLNLSKYYLQWLQQNGPRRHGNQFQFRKMDILDLNDPNDKEFLTDYDAFHQKYTQTGTPVILANVKMTHQPITMDSIVQQCAASKVTESVHVSRKVGERQASNDWGGLEEYVLDEELATPSRIQKENLTLSHPDWLQDEEEELSIGYDHTLTMQQYAILAERLDHLYLHDCTLPEVCDRILYDDTLYSRKQKFQIPSVIASWDLFQRLPQSKYRSSWPSLFVGKKGSNSKLHTDSGATGFFMYLVSGRKRWVVYNRNERVHLYERIDGFATYPDVLGMGKDQASDDFLSARFPLLHRAEAAYEIVQEPGQLVWIPPNCPHAVENLDDIIGFAMNIVPRDGLANHFHQETHNALDLSVFDLAMNYWLFEDSADKPFPTDDPLYTTYGEFKAQY